MRLLVDTHLLIWAASNDPKLTKAAFDMIMAPGVERYFSAASIWEIAIKRSLARQDFAVDPGILRQGLLANGYEELSVTGLHGAAVADLPLHHRDPFDRILVAQAACEGLCLLTVDAQLTRYPGHIRLV
ncbi:MAG TPA: type II toxin-antitoxin system VapC family toxin [Acidocella sp.]|nr:MAG: twitching motility protein PilT [Acidocella sp. 20-58-15]HQT38641.1 type II toxin-antitoxin system VapC family toxin [Acidocella sp.]